ncbi:MAG TPA: alpha/beta hydrolase [Thiotrichales bacterium]|nr:alpha/beta hydrolase [Thiotrichales bacterium]
MRKEVSRPFLRRTIRFLLLIPLAGMALFVAADLLLSRNLPDLAPWHELKPVNEFRADMAGPDFGWPQWLALESRLFEEIGELRSKAFSRIPLDHSRYQPGGNRFARRLSRDWNRSYLLQPERPRGVALLLHGLSDSPYSLRSLALALREAGLNVYGLRLPGHGTVPAALDDIRWQDWLAAVEVVNRHIRRTHPGLPFWMVGYSMGAALTLKHTLDMLDQGLAPPDGLCLLSPALGVNPLARFANLQRLFSELPFFRKSRWLSVLPEFDPYKYQSFTKNAGRQMALLTAEVDAGLKRLQAEGRAQDLPPVLSFQSVVDETVSTQDLMDRLYGVIDDPRSELVLFDINRISFFRDYTRFSPDRLIATLRTLGEKHFRLTLITNVSEESAQVEERSGLASGGPERVRPLALAWPEDVYSLSHIALPFPPDDPVYGYDARAEDGSPLDTLGNLAVRGERNVLSIPAADLLRLRANPFHAYVVERILEFTGRSRAAEGGE